MPARGRRSFGGEAADAHGASAPFESLLEAVTSRAWTFVHDVVAHPLCGLLWIFGYEELGNRLHDLTVHPVNYESERWEPPR